MLVVNKRLCYGFKTLKTRTEGKGEFQSGAIVYTVHFLIIITKHFYVNTLGGHIQHLLNVEVFYEQVIAQIF